MEIFRRNGFGVVWSGLNYLWRLTRPGSIAISQGSAAAKGETSYQVWIRIFDEAPERDRARHEERLAALTRRPLISILAVLPSAGTDSLKLLARGLSRQIYPEFELVIAAPAQDHGEIAPFLVTSGIDLKNPTGDLAGTQRRLRRQPHAALAVAQGENSS